VFGYGPYFLSRICVLSQSCYSPLTILDPATQPAEKAPERQVKSQVFGSLLHHLWQIRWSLKVMEKAAPLLKQLMLLRVLPTSWLALAIAKVIVQSWGDCFILADGQTCELKCHSLPPPGKPALELVLYMQDELNAAYCAPLVKHLVSGMCFQVYSLTLLR
jgi:hypothetical protein